MSFLGGAEVKKKNVIFTSAPPRKEKNTYCKSPADFFTLRLRGPPCFKKM
jgi:hypothetical protein